MAQSIFGKINPWPYLVGTGAIAATIYFGKLAQSGVDFTYEVVTGESLKIRGGLIEGKVKFRLINRGPATIRMQQVALDVLVSGNEAARINTTMSTEIPPRSSVMVVFPIESALLNTLISFLLTLLTGGWSPKARLQGFFMVNGIRIEVDETYDLNISP